LATLVVEQVRTSTRMTCSSILLYGPPGSGKTALAASIARKSEYPFVRFLSADNMVGYSESQRIAEITKSFMESQSSGLSLIVVDDIERLIHWAPQSGTYSNAVLQTLLVLFRWRPPKVIIVAGCYIRNF
jgi:vesicle-fusing ATPase